MATVTVNVNANTGDATQDINQLDKALEGADVAAEQLNNSLEKQEARIKTLGGAINIVGGSVEVLAGSLALTGALSEEQAEKFETAAVGAIAFADGTKRVFEGVKELNEGLAGVGGITGVVTKAFKGLNTVIRANPYIAAATALAALTAGIIAFTQRQDEGKVSADDFRGSLEEQTEAFKNLERAANGADEKLRNLEARAKAYGTTVEEELQADRNAALTRQAELTNEINQLEAALNGTRAINREETEKQLELRKAQLDNAKEFLELLFNTEAAYNDIEETVKNAPGGSKDKPIALFIKPKLVVPEGEEQVDTLAEWFEKQIDVEGAQLRPITLPVTSSVDLGETTL